MDFNIEDDVSLESLGYSSKTIMAFFANKMIVENKVGFNHTDNMIKVNKLAIMSHGYCLSLFDKKLFDDNVIAYKYGPLLSYKDNEGKSIFNQIYNLCVSLLYKGLLYKSKIYIDNIDFVPQREVRKYMLGVSPNGEVISNDNSELDLLNKVWEVFGDESSLALASHLCQDDGFCQKQWDKALRLASTVDKITPKFLEEVKKIPHKSIQHHYKKALER